MHEQKNKNTQKRLQVTEEHEIERNDFNKSLLVYARFQLLTRLYGEGVRDGMNLDELKDYIIWELLYYIENNSMLADTARHDRNYK